MSTIAAWLQGLSDLELVCLTVLVVVLVAAGLIFVGGLRGSRYR